MTAAQTSSPCRPSWADEAVDFIHAQAVLLRSDDGGEASAMADDLAGFIYDRGIHGPDPDAPPMGRVMRPVWRSTPMFALEDEVGYKYWNGPHHGSPSLGEIWEEDGVWSAYVDDNTCEDDSRVIARGRTLEACEQAAGWEVQP